LQEIHAAKTNWENIADIEIIPDNNRGICCGISGNYVNVWAFKVLVQLCLHSQ
jgi:hypothetical protein